MTRFQMELSGKLGQFWQNEAQKELERVKSDLDSCKITIDADGVARNSIGRALADDNAVDDMLSFADFLNSEHTVQWSHQNDVSILIDGDVLNLTGVVNDTSYEFRSRLTVQFYFTQKAVGASTALLESSLQYPTGEKDPETQEPTYTPTEPPETDSKSGPWGDKEEPIVVPTFEPSASGGGTEELAKEETGYFTEVEIKEETGNE